MDRAGHSAGARRLFIGALLLWPWPTVSADGPEAFPLSLDSARFLPAPLRVEAEDLVLSLEEGAGIPVLAAGRVSGLALIGRGRLTFSPPVRSEQSQLRLFSGSETLNASFDEAWVRFHPEELARHLPSASMQETAAPASLARRARALFDRESVRSFALPGTTGGPPLSVLPPRKDFVAEIATARHGRLTYGQIGVNPEDVVLVDAAREIEVASYPSRARREKSGFDYGDETGLPYEAIDYDVDVEIDPGQSSLSGRASVTLLALESLAFASLRLDSGLSVTEVRSADQGAHEFRRARGDTLLVRLDPPLPPDGRIRLETTFAGRVPVQDPARRKMRGAAREEPKSPAAAATDRFLLLSNRVYWFPQSPVRNHTPGRLSVVLPSGWTALASGIEETPAASADGRRRLTFRAEKPIRYFSLLVGKFHAIANPAPQRIDGTTVRVVAAGRPSARLRALASEASEVARFYTALVGESPYRDLTVALLETPVPAGHSPAHLAILGEPPGWVPRSAPEDPTYFAGEPVFSVAHEIAHQWWGQAVGWRNYREQWLSEGLAQYFAALYLRESRGAQAFERALAWMRRWALEAAGQGPISLGVRAGEVSRCDTCFAAIVYDRAACVVDMLRRIVGEEYFFRALRLYYERWKFRRAGTEDLQRSFEEVSGLELSVFFERWVRDDRIPDVRWSAGEVTGRRWPSLRLVLEQEGEPHELPLTLSIERRGRSREEQIVHLRSARREFLFELESPVNRIRVVADGATLCRLEEQRASRRE